MSTEIRVALVYQQDAGTQALRAALANAGVAIAVECRASELASAAILDTAVDAIVVNLDSELEDLLDSVTEALDAARRPVIYNDPAASSDLSGWDRARWMRHLSAKLKGQSNVTPPPPPGAQAIPMPALRPAPAVAAVAPVEALAATPADVDLTGFIESAPAGEPLAAAANAADSTAAMDIPFDLGLADLDLMFDEPARAEPTPIPAAAPTSALTMGDDMGDLDALFDEPTSVEFDQEVTDFAATESLSDLSPAAEPAPAPSQMADTTELDLDSLFAESPAAAEAPPVPVASQTELTDLDALFREFETSQANEASAAGAAAKPAATARPAVEPKGAPLDWSLEPLQELTLDDLGADGAGTATPAPAAPAAAPPRPAGPTIPAALEASLALADFKLLDDVEPETAKPAASTANDLDALDLSSLDLESLEPVAAAPASAAVDFGDELSLADLDFDLEPQQPAARAGTDAGIGMHSDADLGDLDSLFEPMSEAPLFGLSLPDLDRVYVLGASIGGPEAIKAFLAQLPASVPAAFIVAQHMGGEFLEMMAAQLDAASPLPVRCPKAGERLRHGEVIVAPASEQLTIDGSGHIQLSAASSGSPYNPSIDQLVRAAADRFGDHATLILFSGMGSDAVEGGRHLASRGGQVWAQDRASCVIASMIDSAKSQGLVRFEGTPAQLAERVLQVVS